MNTKHATGYVKGTAYCGAATDAAHQTSWWANVNCKACLEYRRTVLAAKRGTVRPPKLGSSPRGRYP